MTSSRSQTEPVDIEAGKRQIEFDFVYALCAPSVAQSNRYFLSLCVMHSDVPGVCAAPAAFTEYGERMVLSSRYPQSLDTSVQLFVYVVLFHIRRSIICESRRMAKLYLY